MAKKRHSWKIEHQNPLGIIQECENCGMYRQRSPVNGYHSYGFHRDEFNFLIYAFIDNPGCDESLLDELREKYDDLYLESIK